MTASRDIHASSPDICPGQISWDPKIGKQFRGHSAVNHAIEEYVRGGREKTALSLPRSARLSPKPGRAPDLALAWVHAVRARRRNTRSVVELRPANSTRAILLWQGFGEEAIMRTIVLVPVALVSLTSTDADAGA